MAAKSLDERAKDIKDEIAAEKLDPTVAADKAKIIEKLRNKKDGVHRKIELIMGSYVDTDKDLVDDAKIDDAAVDKVAEELFPGDKTILPPPVPSGPITDAEKNAVIDDMKKRRSGDTRAEKVAALNSMDDAVNTLLITNTAKTPRTRDLNREEKELRRRKEVIKKVIDELPPEAPTPAPPAPVEEDGAVSTGTALVSNSLAGAAVANVVLSGAADIAAEGAIGWGTGISGSLTLAGAGLGAFVASRMGVSKLKGAAVGGAVGAAADIGWIAATGGAVLSASVPLILGAGAGVGLYLGYRGLRWIKRNTIG